ncbi:SagB family peptide dehydrogenase [Micromonospora sp. DT228]|uniref:SagB family peptide dehydrogenase n=1 Tax=Micromonospora sp. DT228 TaxID=3393443 RepID=UPI003CF974AB
MNHFAAVAATETPLITFWSLRDDVALETGAADGSVLLLTRWGEIPLHLPEPVVLEFLHRMSLGPVSLDNVVGAEADRRLLTDLLDALAPVVIRSVGLADGGGPLLSVVPTTQRSTFDPRPVPTDAVVRFSRMTLMRGLDDVLALESPLATHRVLLHRPNARALAATLAAPCGLGVLAEAASLPVAWIAELVGYLVAAGMVVVAGAMSPPRFAEDDDPVLLLWAPHELLFHARARPGRSDLAFGATFPGEGRVPPEPVLKTRPSGPRYPLFRPRLADLLATDPPLTAAVEARHADRRFGPASVTAEQVGELLYRTARVRALRPGRGAAPDASDRPYPSTGGLHELEFYVVASGPGGVPSGIHHYDPRDHILTLVGEDPQDVSGLLEGTRIAGGLAQQPTLLLEITARFRRISGVYQGGAYAATLRHVGALLQSLYLVTTAMGLAACVVPTRDDDDLTSDVLGLDWRVEATVGGFVLGCPAGTVSEDHPGEVPVNDADWRRLCQEQLTRRY